MVIKYRGNYWKHRIGGRLKVLQHRYFKPNSAYMAIVGASTSRNEEVWITAAI